MHYAIGRDALPCMFPYGSHQKEMGIRMCLNHCLCHLILGDHDGYPIQELSNSRQHPRHFWHDSR